MQKINVASDAVLFLEECRFCVACVVENIRDYSGRVACAFSDFVIDEFSRYSGGELSTSRN